MISLCGFGVDFGVGFDEFTSFEVVPGLEQLRSLVHICKGCYGTVRFSGLTFRDHEV